MTLQNRNKWSLPNSSHPHTAKCCIYLVRQSLIAEREKTDWSRYEVRDDSKTVSISGSLLPSWILPFPSSFLLCNRGNCTAASKLSKKGRAKVTRKEQKQQSDLTFPGNLSHIRFVIFQDKNKNHLSAVRFKDSETTKPLNVLRVW